jgi:phosphate transport system substrate-binding protein
VTITTSKRLVALTVAAAFALGACSTGATNAPSDGATNAPSDGATPEPSMLPISGSIIISGSSTVEPVSALVAELFNERVSADVAIEVTGPGTSDGFARFCAGETDISDASRSIRESEIETCAAAGITDIIELKIAIDGLSIITSQANSAVTCLTFADLYALLGPESQGFDNWTDAQALATELGSSTQLPDAPLEITAPGEESGTYGSFVEIVIEEFNEDRGADAETRPDYTASANDNVIIEGIAGTATSLGWVGFAFAKENEARVKLLEVDNGESGCIAPTPETIASNEYPISRDLYIYVNAAKSEANAAVAAYVDFYLSDGLISEVLEEVPYVPLADDVLDETRTIWANRTTLVP